MPSWGSLFFDELQAQQLVGGHVETLSEADEHRARRLVAGNITDIGLNRFLYDRVSRIKNFEFDSGHKQAYTYDVFGNLTSIATTPPGGSTVTQSLPVAGLTNRLNGAGYDGAGNQSNWGGYGYAYDAFGMMTRMTGGGNDNTHIYTADDERLWTMDFTAGGGEAGTVHTFRLRDADAKVLRELSLTGTNVAGNWSLRKDYIHRDAGRLLASVAFGNVVNHYTLDHLGKPRLVTNSTGGYVSDHHYYAYGQELNPNVSDPMKFTGHERDFNEGGVGNTTDDLDYMHARYCSPVTGRFLSVDPGDSARAELPLSWNRYSYALGNPIRFTDPDGQAADEPSDSAFDRIYAVIKRQVDRLTESPNPQPNNPELEAELRREGINPNLLPQSQARQVKEGFNKASAGLGAAVVLAGLKAGYFAGTINGFTIGGRISLQGGALNLSVSLLARIPGGAGTLRGVLGSFEKAAVKAGAQRLVISGRLASDFFKSDKARRAATKLGYSFETLADGSIILTKSVI